jgi:hypothetical protein
MAECRWVIAALKRSSIAQRGLPSLQKTTLGFLVLVAGPTQFKPPVIRSFRDVYRRNCGLGMLSLLYGQK